MARRSCDGLPRQHRARHLDAAESIGTSAGISTAADFPSVIDNEDEFTEAVESAAAALEPRALISGQTAKAGRARAHSMERVVSKFARRLTIQDQIAEAEAKWGKEVDAAMGPEDDIGRYARRYSELAKNLPSEQDL